MRLFCAVDIAHPTALGAITPCYRSCELIHTMISSLEVESVALHSRLSQAQRLRALAHFKSSRARVLVATDVGSR